MNFLKLFYFLVFTNTASTLITNLIQTDFGSGWSRFGNDDGEPASWDDGSLVMIRTNATHHINSIQFQSVRPIVHTLLSSVRHRSLFRPRKTDLRIWSATDSPQKEWWDWQLWKSIFRRTLHGFDSWKGKTAVIIELKSSLHTEYTLISTFQHRYIQ